MSVEQSIEDIYTSLNNDNEDIDLYIEKLKAAMKQNNQKEAVFDPQRLVQNNRAGRKYMQAYFKKKGIKVVFSS